MVVIHPGRSIGAMYGKAQAHEELISRRPALHTRRGDIWIGTIAELHPIKQHDLAIKAVAKVAATHPKLRYLIIGGGEEESRLQSLIQDLQMEDHIYLLGSIQEAARLLKAFDIFLLASRSEAYGYVIAEAGLAELPVVASRVGGITDIIDDTRNGLLASPDSETEFVDALSKLVADKELRHRLGKQLKADVLPRSDSKMTDAICVIYRQR